MFDRQAVLKATTSIVLGAGLVLAICANASAAVRPQPISPNTPATPIMTQCSHLPYMECHRCCAPDKREGKQCWCRH
jgi:hypothetical protein